MSAYENDPRVKIGLYDAVITGPHGSGYVFAARRDDWVAAPLAADLDAIDREPGGVAVVDAALTGGWRVRMAAS